MRSLSTSANTPRELAPLIVNVTPSTELKFAVASALRNVPAKKDGSVGSAEPGSVMTDPPRRPPCYVDGCIRVVSPWPPKEMLSITASSVKWRCMLLCSRTGIKEVNSYEHKDSTMVRAVGRDVLAAIEARVRAHVVSVAVTVGRSSR